MAGRGLGPRLAARAVAVLGAAAVLVAVLTPLAGLLVADPDPAPSTTSAFAADPDGATADVRELPLLPVGSIDHEQLGDDAAVLEAIHRLAGLLGLGAQIDHLLSVGDSEDPTYPYRYPVPDQVMAADLDPAVVAAEPGAVVELAGLLAVYASARSDSYETGPPPAGTAYSLLSAARRTVETCDLDLTLVWVVTLGDRPSPDVVAEETARAASVCGDDDVMPALVRAHYLSRFAMVTQRLIAPRVPVSELRRAARAAWLDLQERFPGSAYGFAGLGDLESGWADQAEAASAAPFQVLVWRREALAAYEAAISVTDDDPVLEVLAAEVQVRVGEEGAAVERAGSASSRLIDDSVALMSVTDVLSVAGDHAAAAQAVEAELGPATPWWLGRGVDRNTDLTRDYAQRVVPQAYISDATEDGYGGGFVMDHGFLPASRTDVAPPQCRRDIRIRELALAGRLDDAALALAESPGVPPAFVELCGGPDLHDHQWGPLLRVLVGGAGDSAAYDLAQDFLRGAGDLEGAQDVALEWAEASGDGLAHQRLGEIFLLAGDDRRARTELETALPALAAAAAAYDVSMASDLPNPVKDLAVAELQLGLASARLGEADESLEHDVEARDALAPLKAATADFPAETGVYPGDLEAYTHSQAGAVLAARGDRSAAIEEYEKAIEVATPFEPSQSWQDDQGDYRVEATMGGSLSGAQANNLALLLSLDGADDEAIEQGVAAVAEDPASSVFADSLAFAHQRAGDVDDAIAVYRRVVAADPTAYVSANNLGVLLAESGEKDEAADWFRHAVGIRPGYALAWHNLGSSLADHWSPGSFVASQAAMGESVRLDSAFRGARPGFAMDDQVRDLDLDVSKPLDPDWQFSTSVEERGTPFTVVLLLLLLWRVLWSVGLDTVIGRGAEGALERGRRFAVLAAALPAWAAAGASVVLLSGSLLWHGWSWPALLVVLAIVGLVALPLVMRAGARHRSWLPAMVVGAAMAPLGAPYVPYPHLVASRSRPTRRTLLLPAAVAGGALAVFAAESAVLGTPVAHRLTAASAVLLASVLVPVPPLDGSRHRDRALSVVSAIALAGVTVALALGWV